MKNGTITGQTSNGRPFEVTDDHLTYLPHEGVGSIGIPIRAGFMETIAHELTHRGHVSDETRKAAFLT